jgi:hypothetical protein
MLTPTHFSLATYVVRVRNVIDREYEAIDAILDEHDLLDIMRKYLEEIKKETSDDEEARLILRIPRLAEEKRTLSGTIETGAYGHESVLYHRKKKQDVYNKTRDEADMSPFFFLLDVPKGVDEAILILQRSGAYGIRQILYNILASRFESEFDDLRLRIDPLVVDSDLKRLFRRGRVTQIRYCRYGLSSDIADHYEGGHKESPGRMELVFHARRGDHFNLAGKIREVVEGKTVAEVFALEETEFEFDTVKLGLEENGRTKQVDMSHYMKVRSYHDVTENLKILASGHPDFESIKQQAVELLAQTRKQLYGAAGTQ